MPEQNVKIVRRIWEADQQHDAEAVLEAYAPEVEWEDNTGLWGDWGTARGRDGIQAAWRRWHEAFENVQFEWGQVAETGDDVVVTYRARARGRGSGAVVDQSITLLWTLRARKVDAYARMPTERMPSKPPDSRNSRFGRERRFPRNAAVSSRWDLRRGNGSEKAMTIEGKMK